MFASVYTDPGSYKFTIRTKCKRTKNANETNERFTRTIRKMHDTRTNERNETNELCSIEVQYSIVLLFEWFLWKLT